MMSPDNEPIQQAPDKKDFFISYNSADTGWAEWIAWVLEEQGYSVHVQAWDFRPGNNFVHEMQVGAASAERTIALLSPGYLGSRFTAAEWYAAFARDPRGENRLLIPIRVQECDPAGLLGPIIFEDLSTAKNETRARDLVLGAVRLGRAKPAGKPAFPGGAKPAPRPSVRFPGNEPDFRNLPRIRNPNFTGRDELLDALRASLRQGGRSTLCAVSGLGGIGKSQTALEYGYRFAADYDIVWWVRAETAATRLADLRALVRAAGLEAEASDPAGSGPSRADNGVESDDGATLTRLLRPWLAERRWLVVLDNVSSPSEVEGMLHELGAGGHVLITSRDPNWRRLGSVLQVPPLGTDEAARFLLGRCGRVQDEGEMASARELARELGELPLALEHAAAYMEQHSRSPAEYLKLYTMHRLKLLDRGAGGDDKQTIAGTWAVSLHAIAAAKPAAEELMRVLSFLAPDEVPLEIVRKYARFMAPGLGMAARDDLEWDEVVGALLRHSLVTPLQGDSVAVHRLVQEVVHAGMEPGKADSLREALWHALSTELPSNTEDHTLFPIFARLVPHVEAIMVRGGQLPTTNLAGWWLAVRVARYFRGKGALREARTFAERALAAAEIQVPASDIALSRALTILGQVLQGQGDLAGGRKMLERALEIYERVDGRDPPNLAAALNNLASVLQDQGDLAGARERLERALDISERVDDQHPAVAAHLSNLGSVLQDQGDLSGARKSLERALIINERLYGPQHPAVASDLSSLGSVLQDLGDLTGARAMLDRALQIDQHVYGADHPWFATTLSKVGSVQRNQGEFDGAQEKLERAFEIHKRVLGLENPWVATSLFHLARVLHDRGDHAGAVTKLECACDMYKQLLGEHHWYSGISQHRLGEALVVAGRLSEGLPLLETAVEIIESQVGRTHVRIASALDSLGEAYRLVERLEDAEVAHRQAVDIHTRSVGEDAFWTAWSKRLLAVTLLKKGEIAEARMLLESAHSVCLKSLGPDHPKTRQVASDLQLGAPPST